MADPQYIGQHGTACHPIALCNALRFWGFPSPEPGTPEWEIMQDLAGCRDGDGTCFPGRVADWLGVIQEPTSLHFLRRGQMLPSLVGFRSPEGVLHAALVIEIREGARPFAPDLLFVNYRVDPVEGSPFEWVPWDDVAWDDGNDGSIGYWVVPRWRSGFRMEMKPLPKPEI